MIPCWHTQSAKEGAVFFSQGVNGKVAYAVFDTVQWYTFKSREDENCKLKLPKD